MKSSVIVMVACFFLPLHSFAQCQNISFQPACTTPVYAGPCPTWANGCGANWTRSNGTPELDVFTYIDPKRGISVNVYYGYMWSQINPFGGLLRGEGMFSPFAFTTGQTVTITIRAVTTTNSGTGTGGSAFFYATQGLSQSALNQCGDAIPIIPSSQKQFIGEIDGTFTSPTDFTFTFTPSSSWTQIWMYPQANSTDQYNLSVYNIEICSACDQTIVFNTGTVPALQTTAGAISVGSTAGTGGSGTVTINSAQPTALIAAVSVKMLPSFQAIVTGSGSFKAFINPCGYVPPISSDSTNYDSITVAPPPPPLESSSAQPLEVVLNGANVFDLPGNNSDRKLLIYPSITTGTVKITGVPQALSNSDIIIYDELGRSVFKSENIGNTEISLDLSNLSDGVYFLQMKSRTGKTIRQRIIVQK